MGLIAAQTGMPGADSIAAVGKNPAAAAGAPDVTDAAHLAAQARRVKIASRVFKVLSGAAVVTGGVLLLAAGIVTGSSGAARGTGIAAGALAMIKGGFMVGEGIAGKTIGDRIGSRHPKLAAFVEVLPSILDMLGSAAVGTAQLDSIGGKSLDWDMIPNTVPNSAKISSSSLESFAKLDVGGKVGKVNPGAMARILAEASEALSGLKDNMQTLNNFQLGQDIRG